MPVRIRSYITVHSFEEPGLDTTRGLSSGRGIGLLIGRWFCPFQTVGAAFPATGAGLAGVVPWAPWYDLEEGALPGTLSGWLGCPTGGLNGASFALSSYEGGASSAPSLAPLGGGTSGLTCCAGGAGVDVAAV